MNDLVTNLVNLLDTSLYISRISQIGYKFRERAELAVNSEKKLNWLSIWRKSQNTCQFEDEANFLKTQTFS